MYSSRHNGQYTGVGNAPTPHASRLLRSCTSKYLQIRSSICSIAVSAPRSLQTTQCILWLVHVTFLQPSLRGKSWVTRTSKSFLIMSAKPSESLGSRYLEAKPLNATCGRIVRDSRFVCGWRSDVSMGVSPCGNGISSIPDVPHNQFPHRIV